MAMTLAFGIDIGRVHDATVIVVAEDKDGKVYIRKVTPLRNEPFNEQEADIGKLSEALGPDIVAVDSTGIGLEMSERLKSTLNVLVLPVPFTEATKAELIGVVYNDITSHKLVIPRRYSIVAEEFANIRKETTAAGNVVFRDSPHGDVAWATALASYALRHVGGVFLVGDAKELFPPAFELGARRAYDLPPDWGLGGRTRPPGW
jgi:phage FluMu gp28-like protein